jgi:NAD(P)-dependent dehydrogenase (short-subunit alcohol dehydrogenase family)
MITQSDQARPPRILISGGGGGVGLACAEALSAAGAELLLCDIDGMALTQTAERLHAFARFCDAIEDNSVAILAAEIAEKFSSIDVLINAAGRGYVRALGMMRMTRAFMPLLRRASGRRMLVNIAPAGGFVSSDGMFPYASSRSAFERLTEAIAEQTRGTSIEVVNVTPKLLRGGLANDCPTSRLYQLQRVDEQCTADYVADVVVSAPATAARRCPPGQCGTSRSG